MRRAIQVIAISLGLLLGTTPAADAQRRPLSIVRDAEIEYTIAAFAEPILRAAGIAPGTVNFVLVDDAGLNAFVADGQNIFINTGLLLAAESPLEIIGVLAHETGHLAGGHQARGRDAIERARRTALVTAIIGVAAAIASGSGDLAAAGVVGGQASAQSSFLTFSRGLENAADQAALTYLDRAGISAEGLLHFMELLGDQELLPASAQAEYVRTHPLTRDRVDVIRHHVESSMLTGTPSSPTQVENFRRLQAKLLAYLSPQRALREFDGDDSRAARYGLAVAYWRRSELGNAIDLMQRLASEEPSNPFFAEFLGQLHLERGEMAEATQNLGRAAGLSPGSALILIELAQAEVAAGQDSAAIGHLEQATRLPGGDSPLAYRLLATAYGRRGELGMAALNLSEEALARGDTEGALQQAQRALDQMPSGSPGRIRAQDILATAR